MQVLESLEILHVGEKLSMENIEKTLLQECLLKIQHAALVLEDFSAFGDEHLNTEVIQQAQDLLFSAKSSIFYLQNTEKRKDTVRTLMESNCVKLPERGNDNPVVIEFPVRNETKSTRNIERLKTFGKDAA